ncbi:pyridoxamine 5'-phosphate oxidase family protein [Curtobacterium poinsettiae]|uniref:pyridoxamine 5'-phosphate oxidase family protein n=1 Tax=Curtobacterium poinsettiae TaxID=159612 RepID=UPI0021CA54FF|nr:pyridoxamine 5'-phosphate oxidase family protein [Curtobacterium flaccumfaciens]MCU0113703.1 pyridoxamine 5'-phosphate oxidase family protein [Curtobacterium flaccumfaciens]
MTDTQTEQRAAISDIVHGAHTALLTTVSEDGNLHARPLAVQDKTFHGTLRFLVQDGSEKVEDIARNPHVNVSIESQGGYLSIAGTATVTQDDSVVDELWSPFAEAWFPEGRQDPTIRLLTVEGSRSSTGPRTPGRSAAWCRCSRRHSASRASRTRATTGRSSSEALTAWWGRPGAGRCCGAGLVR